MKERKDTKEEKKNEFGECSLRIRSLQDVSDSLLQDEAAFGLTETQAVQNECMICRRSEESDAWEAEAIQGYHSSINPQHQAPQTPNTREI